MAKKKGSVARRVRICQRTDGTVFTWTPVLDAKPGMRPGWINIYDDGSRHLTLDVATSRELDARTISQREQNLIDENARMRQELAEARGLVGTGDRESPVLPPGGPIEQALAAATQGMPASEAEGFDLTAPAALKEEPIKFAEREAYPKSTLHTMRKAGLIAHARSFDPNVEIPETFVKQDLVDLCLELQTQAVGE